MQRQDAIKRIEFYCEKGKDVVCPFSSEKCQKVSRSQLGICSFVHQGKEQIICPNLLLKFDYLSLIASQILNTTSYTVIKEAKINNNFIDFILVDKNNTKNYCGVEVQTLDTSGNYQWVFGEKVKPFCVNWKTTKKTIFSQLLEKVPLFLENNKKLVLTIQDTFFDYCRFPNNEFDLEKDFHVLELAYSNYEFVGFSLHSYDYIDLLSLFRHEESIDLDRIIESYIHKGKKKQ